MLGMLGNAVEVVIKLLQLAEHVGDSGNGLSVSFSNRSRTGTRHSYHVADECTRAIKLGIGANLPAIERSIVMCLPWSWRHRVLCHHLVHNPLRLLDVLIDLVGHAARSTNTNT